MYELTFFVDAETTADARDLGNLILAAIRAAQKRDNMLDTVYTRCVVQHVQLTGEPDHEP